MNAYDAGPPFYTTCKDVTNYGVTVCEPNDVLRNGKRYYYCLRSKVECPQHIF